MSEMKCVTCAYKFKCLAEHHIPENYGNDCEDYVRTKWLCVCGHRQLLHRGVKCLKCDCTKFIEDKGH